MPLSRRLEGSGVVRHSSGLVGAEEEGEGLRRLALSTCSRTPRLGLHVSNMIGSSCCQLATVTRSFASKWALLVNKCMPPLLPVGPQAMSSWGPSVTLIAPWPTKLRPLNLCRTCNLWPALSGPLDHLLRSVSLVRGR